MTDTERQLRDRLAHTPLPVGLEILLKTMLGSRYHGLAGHPGRRTWKRVLGRVLGGLQRAVHVNIRSTDALHLRQIRTVLDAGISETAAARSTDAALVATVECLIKLVLLLLGGYPDNYARKAVNHDNHWRLDRERTVAYTQTFDQKAAVLLFKATQGAMDHEQESEVRETYRKTYRDPVRFLEWFRDRHSSRFKEAFPPLP